MTTTDSRPVPQDVLVLHPLDNVATALRDLEVGHAIPTLPDTTRPSLVLREAIAMCHKFALCDMAPGATVIKYGEAIGHASRAIVAGEHVHIHNLRSARAQTPSRPQD